MNINETLNGGNAIPRVLIGGFTNWYGGPEVGRLVGSFYIYKADLARLDLANKKFNRQLSVTTLDGSVKMHC